MSLWFFVFINKKIYRLTDLKARITFSAAIYATKPIKKGNNLMQAQNNKKQTRIPEKAQFIIDIIKKSGWEYMYIKLNELEKLCRNNGYNTQSGTLKKLMQYQSYRKLFDLDIHNNIIRIRKGYEPIPMSLSR
ncbi:hypothetical protein [Candidatus Neptunichlamydia sp. REUL1]|uniref:hypothetical protein n=1 Tax=Candidatus Neptunichlamydia sp. REUL1 TaxID=3064277 RepID=UPI00292D6469|nr:hypothetical protein [Candidatus Neptunochlamydia sp. REUL1]